MIGAAGRRAARRDAVGSLRSHARPPAIPIHRFGSVRRGPTSGQAKTNPLRRIRFQINSKRLAATPATHAPLDQALPISAEGPEERPRKRWG
ncbi:MAG: hypothetical protein CL933_26615 [Deltaproteobacteria bacterium]|nr:hypothetical protein [Deltaproteobacteria bacterium]